MSKGNLTAHKVWLLVEAEMTAKSDMVRVDLRGRMQQLRCDENGNVRNHLDTLLRMKEDYAAIGGSIDDADFRYIVMGGMPREFNTFIATISAASHAAGKTLTSEELIGYLNTEYDRRAIEAREGGNSALSTQFGGRGNQRKGRSPGRSTMVSDPNVVCTNCTKPGHLQKDCYRKGSGKAGQAPWQKKQKQKEKEKEQAANATSSKAGEASPKQASDTNHNKA